jgi:hypothetical protein
MMPNGPPAFLPATWRPAPNLTVSPVPLPLLMISATPVAPPLIETVANGELPARALATTVEQMRASGLNDETIRQAVAGEPVTKQEVEMAKRYQQMKHGDAEWVRKLLAGDFVARREQLLLSIILTNPVKG